MLTCVIVDDEKGAIEILSEYVEQTPDLECVSLFRDSVEALNFLSRNPVDVLFLDIDMPNLSGMQLSELVRKQGIQIVFCTAYSEYAVESYKRDAVDYLLKPIDYQRFLQAVGKVRQRVPGDGVQSQSRASLSEKIFIKSGSRIHQLDLKNLLYMKKDGHYITFHSTIGKIISRMNMEELLTCLPENRFVRVHKSYVVSLNMIDTIERHELFIQGKEIPIGDRFRADFLKRIDYAGK